MFIDPPNCMVTVLVTHNYCRNESFGLTEVICQSNGSRAAAILHNLTKAAQFLIICMIISDKTIYPEACICFEWIWHCKDIGHRL